MLTSVFRIRRLLAWFLARVQKAVNSRFCSVLSRDLSWVPSTVCGSWCARPLTRSETLKDISFSSAGFSFSSVQFSWLLGVLITVFLRRGRKHRDRLICHGVFHLYDKSHGHDDGPEWRCRAPLRRRGSWYKLFVMVSASVGGRRCFHFSPDDNVLFRLSAPDRDRSRCNRSM